MPNSFSTSRPLARWRPIVCPSHSFTHSPGAVESQQVFDDLMSVLAYDSSFTSTDYSSGSAAALGNHIAECMIAYGLQDGSNELNADAIQSVVPVNPSRHLLQQVPQILLI